MKKQILILILVILVTGCTRFHWSRYYPYSRIDPEKFHHNLPVDYEDCLVQFDSILSPEVVEHYREEDSSVAYIKISQAIGGAFINFWNLSFYWVKPDIRGGIIITARDGKRPQVLVKFVKDSVSDPQAMIRILFKCYHKKLNGLDYNWDEEISLMRAFWKSPQKGEGWVSKAMRIREEEILISHHCRGLNVGDTVDVLYNGSSRFLSETPDWYYLTGIIQEKYSEYYSIKVKLINIETRFKNINYIKEDDRIINIGDTATYYAGGWLKRGTYYFDYHWNKEYRERIGKKYR